jgi:hypothetical protein
MCHIIIQSEGGSCGKRREGSKVQGIKGVKGKKGGKVSDISD